MSFEICLHRITRIRFGEELFDIFSGSEHFHLKMHVFFQSLSEIVKIFPKTYSGYLGRNSKFGLKLMYVQIDHITKIVLI